MNLLAQEKTVRPSLPVNLLCNFVPWQSNFPLQNFVPYQDE